jgi:hypothetical protein
VFSFLLILVRFTHRTLNESAASFPPEFASHRVLPSLISALEFGGASAATILPLVLQLGKNVSPEEYSSVVLAPLIKLYTSPDRGTRMALLDHLPEYADKLDKKSVADKIWPNLVGVSYISFELTLTLATFCAHSKQDFRIRLL